VVCGAGESLLRCGRFLNVAHRGGAALRPENTLPAFAHAAALGADVLEMDVQATADGVVVLMHDPTVDRTTDGAGPVSSFTVAALRQLDAGWDFTPDGGTTFPLRGQGIRVPTLEQVLTAFPDHPTSIEIKQYRPSIVDAVLDVLRRTGAASRAVVVSFDDATVAELRAKAPPALLTGMSLGETVAFAGLPPEAEESYVAPAPVVQIPKYLVTPAVAVRAERMGLVLQVWTVDDRPGMDALLDLGVAGVMSNDPALVAAALAEAGVDSGARPGR
jgi:glycerophosphoryl diester phosphodiesterase